MINDELQKLVDEQSNDEELWFEAEFITEKKLQEALKKLHKLIEDRG